MKLRKEILMRIAISKKEIEDAIKKIDESISISQASNLKWALTCLAIFSGVLPIAQVEFDEWKKATGLFAVILLIGAWLVSPKRSTADYSPRDWELDKPALSHVFEEANEALKSIGKETVVVDLEQSLHQILKQLVKLEKAIDKFYYPVFKYPSTFTKHNLFSSTTNRLDDENNEAVNNMIKSFHHGR